MVQKANIGRGKTKMDKMMRRRELPCVYGARSLYRKQVARGAVLILAAFENQGRSWVFGILSVGKIKRTMPRWTVGLVFTKKKIERSGFIGIEDYAQGRNIRIVQMDLSRSLESQGPVDAIVHKMTDVVGKMRRGDAEAQVQCDRFMTFCEENPHVIVLDRWENVEKVLDRVDVFDHLRPCIDTKDPLFKIPHYHTLESIKYITKLAEELSFPVICKRRSACSSAEAHQMTLVPSRRHLTDMHDYNDSEALVIQQFIQHDGVIVKVYVIDGQIHVSTRPSFMNVTEETGMVSFDSQKLPKQFDPTLRTDSRYHVLSSDTNHMQRRKEEILDHDRLRRISSVVQDQLGLTFFGFDVLLESGTNDYYVVDVNYFPSKWIKMLDDQLLIALHTLGFKNVPLFQSMFIDILQERLTRCPPLPA
ncbi:hypothetical protein [Absidia glauca]|uniref:Uncharacterized protein n=1 Tax=Absidia glauca TaxID=4829 RepID=A0A168Q0H3_ABSGL|nr:hypothetical protein [Absidia glauca]